jgi:hypothetical protein
MRSNRRLLETVLPGSKSCHTDRATMAMSDVFSAPSQTEQKQKRRRESEILHSDRHCTGTQKLQRRGQKLGTVSKSRLLDRIVSAWYVCLFYVLRVPAR